MQNLFSRMTLYGEIFSLLAIIMPFTSTFQYFLDQFITGIVFFFFFFFFFFFLILIIFYKSMFGMLNKVEYLAQKQLAEAGQVHKAISNFIVFIF